MGLLDLELTIHACGPVPVDTAWQRYDQLDLWPTWSPQLRYVSTDPDPLTGVDDDTTQRPRTTTIGRSPASSPIGCWRSA